MNYLHKSSINHKKNLQLKKNFDSVTNINRKKLSKPLNLIIDKDYKKISQIKIYQGLNTYNEDLDKNTTKSISNISLNAKNNELNFKKRIKISLSKNEIIKNTKQISLINNNSSNKRINMFNSSQNMQRSLPSFKNQNNKIIIKTSRNTGKKFEYNHIKRELFLNKDISNNTLSYKSTINYFRQTSKKSFKTQRTTKNITKTSSLSINIKTEENTLKAREKLSNIQINKKPIKTVANRDYNGRKEYFKKYIFKNLNYFKDNNTKIRKIKFKQNQISIYRYLENKRLLKKGYCQKASNTSSNIIYNDSKRNDFQREKNKNLKKANLKDNELIKRILNKTTSDNSFHSKIVNSTINKFISFQARKEIGNYTDKINGINNDIYNLSKTNRSSGTKKTSYKNCISVKNKISKIMNNYQKKLIKNGINNTMKIKSAYNKNENEKILIEYNEPSKLEKFQFDILDEIKVPFIKVKEKKSNGNIKKNENSNIEYPNEIECINLKMNMKIYQSHNKREKRFKLHELLKCDNFIQIIFSFCESDINLLNTICLISKEIFRKIKPLIYKKISLMISRYNSNISTKNKIKEYLMKNYSDLFRLSPSILYIKYHDLLLENNKNDNEIKKDLTRTFPDNMLFKHGNAYYNKLYHILTAYTNLNKNFGYVQGINYIAAQVLYIYENEIDELIFLDALINKSELDKILDNNLNNEYYEKIFKNINIFIAKQLPRLNTFLSDIKLNIEFFTTNWILTLFSNSMDTEFLVIVWDYLIIFGWKFIKYFILNILLKSENDILNSLQSDLTHAKKNFLKNDKFKNNFQKILKDTEQLMISDDNLI